MLSLSVSFLHLALLYDLANLHQDNQEPLMVKTRLEDAQVSLG